MNYTESLDNVVDPGTGQRMHTDAAAITTVWSGRDSNSVIWSLMELVKAAGKAPKSFNPADPSSYQVLLASVNALIEARVGDYVTDTGVANDYVIALNPVITVPTHGMEAKFRVAHANTHASTLNAGGGPKPLVKNDGTGTADGDLPLDVLASVTFDGPTDSWRIDGLVASQTLTKTAADLRYLQIGASTLPSGLPLMWTMLDCPSFAVVRDGSALTRTAYPGLFAVLCPTRSASITLNVAGAIISGLSRTTDLWVGMPVEHANLPAGTTVKTIDGAAQVTLSANATAAAAGVPMRFFLYGYGAGGSVLTFGVPDDRGLFERALDSGSRGYEKTIISGTTSSTTAVSAISSTRGLFIGQGVSGSGIQVGTTIAGISAAGVTLSLTATSSVAGNALTINGGQIGNERADDFKSHNHVVSGVLNFNWDVQGGTTQTVSNSNQVGTSSNAGGAETRPRFRAYLPIITI